MFVKLLADLYCKWEGIPPTYRIYVDGEMVMERDYAWLEPVYLTEIIQIDVPQDKLIYIEIKPVGPQISEFELRNCRVHYCDNHVRLTTNTSTKFNIKILDQVNPRKRQYENL